MRPQCCVFLAEFGGRLTIFRSFKLSLSDFLKIFEFLNRKVVILSKRN